MPMIEGYMFEEHDLLRRAATECMCNLATSKEVRAGAGSLPAPRAGSAQLAGPCPRLLAGAGPL